MARKFALNAEPLSGKSTLAKHLQDTYGFIHANHSLSVVRSFVQWWNEMGDVPPITIEHVLAHKEQYRRDLQQHGYDVGFNDAERMEYWITQTLSNADCLVTKTSGCLKMSVACPDKDVVFEAVRGEEQAAVLRSMGFSVVQIWISDEERRRRADAMDKDYGKIDRAMKEHPELERGIKQPGIRLNGELSTEVLGRILMHRDENARGYQIFGSQIG